MLSRSESLISLATIQAIEPHDAQENGTPVADIATNQPEPNTTLCARCQNFDIQSFARAASRRKGYLLEDVEAAAKQGCQFCGLLLDAVRDIERPHYFYAHVFKGKTTMYPDLYVHMTVCKNDRDESNATSTDGLGATRFLIELGDRFSGMRNPSDHEICIAADPGTPAALSGDVLGRYIGDNPTSLSHFETAQRWLQECASHTKCNETVSGITLIDSSHSLLPTRVLEITQEDGRQRLYLRHTAGLHGAYITLTHRWNEGTSRCVTTTSNLEDRLLGHGFEGLPQLFQDAFVIAERLGVKFVWIDSICIIQKGDNLIDWRCEAPKMAQYYQFSVFTLAGTAEDVTGGILQPYKEDAVLWSARLIRLPYIDRANALAGFFYCFRRRVPIVKEYMDEVRSSVLFRRGWILQEWLLSKKVLWYTPRGIFFECHQELPRLSDQSQLTFNQANPDLRAHLKLKNTFHFSNTDIVGFWYSALEVYSGQHLTKAQEDRILAVAGLAKEVVSILANPSRLQALLSETQSEAYVAGLWLRDIHHGLLWEEHHTAGPWTEKVESIPSWSWASVITPVCWPERSKGTKGALKVTGICFRRQGRHDMPDHPVFGGHNVIIEGPTFDPANMFSCLHIRGKLSIVHVRGYLESEENLNKAALSTSYSPIPKSCTWRAICSPLRPEIVAGWGSLEQLNRHPTACADFGVAVHALHVSTRYLRHGVWLKSSAPVLDVLFLEEVELGSNTFRRLGVGRVADTELINEFKGAAEHEFLIA